MYFSVGAHKKCLAKVHYDDELVVFFLLCWGSKTPQPVWVILCRSPREREKRDRRDSRGDESEGQGRKRTRMKVIKNK